MRCRINFESDPISLTIIAADGYEHLKLEDVGHNGIIEVGIGEIIEGLETEKNESNQTLKELQIPYDQVELILKKVWINCWREFTNRYYYKGEPMSGVYISTETMTDDEIFEIIKTNFDKWIESNLPN